MRDYITAKERVTFGTQYKSIVLEIIGLLFILSLVIIGGYYG